MQKRPKTSSPFCQNKCSFYIVNLNLAKNILFEVCGRFNSMITVCGLAKVAILTTKLHTKNRTSIIRKIVIRSTEPPLLPNRCYRQWFFSVVVVPCLFCTVGVLSRAVAWQLFCIFCLAMCVGKNANVLPNAWA